MTGKKTTRIILITLLAFVSCGLKETDIDNPDDNIPDGGGGGTIDPVLTQFFDETLTPPAGYDNQYHLKTSDPVYTEGNGYSLWKLNGSWAVTPVSIDCQICKVSGASQGAYGIMFMAEDPSFLAVLINTNGYYLFGRFESGIFSVLKGWTYSNYLNTGYNINNDISIKPTADPGVYEVFFNASSVAFFQDNTPNLAGTGYGCLATVLPTDNFPAIPVEVYFSTRIQ